MKTSLLVAITSIFFASTTAYAQTTPYRIDCDENGCTADATQLTLFSENNITSGNTFTKNALFCNNTASPLDLFMQLANLTETVPGFSEKFTVTLPDTTNTTLAALAANQKLVTTAAQTCTTLPMTILVGDLDNTFQTATLSFDLIWTIEQDGQVLASVDSNTNNILSHLPLTGIQTNSHTPVIISLLFIAMLIRKLSQRLLERADHSE